MRPSEFVVDVAVPMVMSSFVEQEEEEDDDVVRTRKEVEIISNWKKTRLQSIGDYTIGGAIAGALFQGASVRTKTAERLSRAGIHMSSSASSAGSSKMVARTGILAGMIPGATLGFLAGVTIVGLDVLEMLTVEALREEEEGAVASMETNRKGDDDDGIPEDIKQMSSEEIERQIDLYRSTLKQPPDDDDDDDTIETKDGR